jgi:hypothetical protein
MSALEARYRRLLRWYPRAYRAEYEDEMLGVLMAGAAPGQRHPRLSERLNLLGTAATTWLGRSGAGLADGRWARGAAVFGVLGALALAALHLAPLLAALTWWWLYVRPEPLPRLWMAPVPTLLWALVAILAALGRRRPAALLAWAGLGLMAYGLVALSGGGPGEVLRWLWVFVLAVTVAGTVSIRFAEPTPARRIGPLGTVVFGVAAAVASGAAQLHPLLTRVTDYGDGVYGERPLPSIGWGLLGEYGWPTQVAWLASAVAMLVVVVRLDPVDRRRVLVLSLPAAAMLAVSTAALADPTGPALWTGATLIAPPLIAVAGPAWVRHRERRAGAV